MSGSLHRIVILVVSAILFAANPVQAQQALSLETVIAQLEKDGNYTHERAKVTIEKYDYRMGNENVEALTFRPTTPGKFPGLLLIPGFSRTSRDYIPMGLRFAREGFACVAITQPGFGKSTGKSDFVGPRTIKTLETGYQKFRQESYVDSGRMGIFGYSRGAMAASLLATRLKEVQAAVFAAGVYDFKRAYADVKLPGIRENMEAEAGMTDAAIRERTSLAQMANLSCPVLILHGEKDENAPVNQAYLLRDELTRLKKPFEIKLFPDKDHNLGREDLNGATLDFFRRHLLAGPSL